MILAAGLTPAWQQILLLNQLQIGEVNRASQALWCSSGKVLNVGIALAHLQVDSVTLAPIGGRAATEIEVEFQDLKANACWIRDPSPTRVCTTILDRLTGQTTELVENAHPLANETLTEFLWKYVELASRASTAVLTGSLPAKTPKTFYRDLLKSVPQTSVVLDARGEELLLALPFRPLVVKPNREELGITLGREIRSETEIRQGINEILERGAQWVVMTDGKEPTWVACREQAYRLIPSPAEHVINPIGCGDCLAAGLAWGIAQGLDIPEAVRHGMASASQNLEKLLPARLESHSLRSRAAQVKILKCK